MSTSLIEKRWRRKLFRAANSEPRTAWRLPGDKPLSAVSRDAPGRTALPAFSLSEPAGQIPRERGISTDQEAILENRVISKDHEAACSELPCHGDAEGLHRVMLVSLG
jgi:hypothetical protein